MIPIEYDVMYGVYKIIYGDEVILTETNNYQEAVSFAKEFMESGGI